MPNKNKITLTKDDIKFAEKLPMYPAGQRLQIDRRADKNKRVGK